MSLFHKRPARLRFTPAVAPVHACAIHGATFAVCNRLPEARNLLIGHS